MTEQVGRQFIADTTAADIRDANGEQVTSVLVRTFDKGETWEMALRVNGRWGIGTNIVIVEERW